LNAVEYDKKTCALRAPTAFSARMKNASAQKTRLWIKPRMTRVAFIQDRRLRADVLFIRAQPTIRADGFSSAQLQFCNEGGAIQVTAHNRDPGFISNPAAS
jgi:hypothetical protein